MDKFSVCWHGNFQGEVAVREEGLYTWFHARCRLPEEGLWCVWITGRNGELRLGVLEPYGNGAEIKRRFSGSITKPIGQILGAELRRVEPERQLAWRCGAPVYFKTPWIGKAIAGVSDMLVREEKRRKMIAIPFSVDQEFPLAALFCFAEIEMISGKNYAVFTFDEREWPLFKSDFRG